ncbi:N-acetylglucosamine-1-phosphodiester alpha-N-acetylglucosaminidase [Trichomycterus rosablanca]|uniref:N-acetylglucosamine-1-phosphodiester alpha-N-acetylglucosaminidase n=1 Tax=Trichomycterus rosablanca TaxID=2290929 RepID=UPI002F35F478
MAKLLKTLFYVSLFVIWFLIWRTESKTYWQSVDDDVLSPYASSHGPSHSHRHVRDCQPIIHGNVTHETWQASNYSGSSVVESRSFVSAISSNPSSVCEWVSGHITVVLDPLRTVSVLEPGGPGGCEKPRRELVEKTARMRKCLIAQNGGYFVTGSGLCLGNIVSDGRLVQDSKGVQNAQFGIRKDGTLVFGYLSEEDVLDEVNPFVQLISGVVWLLRAGEVYINESIQAECSKTQETGTFRRFVNVISARTAVGHDREGRLILFHIDGQTDHRGMNLWQVAQFLKEQGVINAINLDGGGSSTFVINGTLTSYPSDHCIEAMWRCPRAVSTVLCVHERLCQPEDCNKHGTCIDGQCACNHGWTGPTCANLTCQPRDCGEHGLCTEDGCVCDAGWMGANCSLECPLGFHGLQCLQQCQCSDLCPCDPVTGSCNATFTGQRNISLHRAGHCLATQKWKEWREQEEAHTIKPYFSERSWLVITAILAVILLTSLIGNLTLVCGKCRGRQQRDYSYVPLHEVNSSTDSALRSSAQSSKGTFRPDDTDSQDSL